MFDFTLPGKVATLAIARPEKRNAIAAANWAELAACRAREKPAFD